MQAYIFFSVYERLFDPLARELRSRYGVTKFAGFCWGLDQAAFLERSDNDYQPLFVFSRDVLPKVPASPDLDYLAACESRYGTPINRMIAAERHLLAGRTHDQVLCLVEAIFRHVEAAYDRARPDFVFSENVSCMTSYIHHVVAKGRNIPFLSIAQSRISPPLIVSRDGLQEFSQVKRRFVELQARELSPAERADAVELVEGFRNRPRHPSGMDVHGRVPTVRREDGEMLLRLIRRPVNDRGNPTRVGVRRALLQRTRRLARIGLAQATKLFETAPLTAPYVLYPLHVQPEASTLVQAPHYLDQVALIADMARSLPVGYRLYVKEHSSSRGRRPISFYQRIRELLGVYLFGPDEPVWPMIQNAAAIAVITGTMGWEGVLLKKPVITFGSVYFNDLPFVYKAKDVAKDEWSTLFRRAIFSHVHDEELLLKYASALVAGSHAGEMHNPGTVPRVLEPANIRHMADALAREVGLHESARAD